MAGSTLIAQLKKVLKIRGLTYKALASSLGMSEAGVKRAFAHETFTVGRVEEICRLLGMTFADLIKLDETATERDTMHLSEEQEQALASDEKLLCLCYLLLRGMQPADVVAAYKFDAKDLPPLLSQLDRLGLVQRNAFDIMRPLKSPNFIWREGGPLFERYWAQVKNEFLDHDFQTDSTHLTFYAERLSPSSLAILRKKIDALVREFHDLGRLDRIAGDAALEDSVWFLTACRPWHFSEVAKFKRVKGA